MSWRVAVAVFLLVALVAAIAFLGRGAAPRPEDGGSGGGESGNAALIDSASCRECHAEIYAQWEGSQHAKAYLNPDVRELSGDHSNQNCIPCHAPRPIFELGLQAMPRSRSTHREQGVSCLSCHLIPASVATDGVARLAGSRDIAHGTCALEVVKTPELATYRSCEPCHNQHETTDQWKATPYGKEGPGFRSCADCHMERREFAVARGVAPRVAWDHSTKG